MKKGLVSFYDRVYEKGEKKHYTKLLFTKKMPNDVREVLREVEWRGKTVVDVGCGTGLLAYHLAKRGAKVLGIDFSEQAIKIACSTYRHPNLEFRCMDAKKLSGRYGRSPSCFKTPQSPRKGEGFYHHRLPKLDQPTGVCPVGSLVSF